MRSHVARAIARGKPVHPLNVHEESQKMAKRQEAHTEFTLREARHFYARGLQSALGAIEKAIADGIKVLHEVWQWVANFIDNPRALSLLKANAPALVPEKFKSA